MLLFCESQLLLAAELPFFFTHLMPLALVLAGGAMTLGAVASLWRALGSYRWATAPGRVLEAASVEVSSGGGETDYTVCTPKVRYAFAAGGASYAGTRLTLSDRSFGSEAAAAASVRKYPKDAPVTVYYRVKDPAQCVLVPGPSFGHLMAFFFPLLFLLGGVELFLTLPTLHH